MARILQIATVGRDLESVLIALRDFPAAKVILLYEERDQDVVREIASRLIPMGTEVERMPQRGAVLTQVLGLVAKVVHSQARNFDEVIVNPSSGSNLLSCSLLSAAFVHGLRAIGVADGKCMALPVLRLAYSEAVSGPKMKVLRALEEAGGSVESLNDLAERLGLEKSLLSYHIRGDGEAKGLEQMNLVSVERAKQGRLVLRLTEMGTLVLNTPPAPALPPEPTTDLLGP